MTTEFVVLNTSKNSRETEKKRSILSLEDQKLENREALNVWANLDIHGGRMRKSLA